MSKPQVYITRPETFLPFIRAELEEKFDVEFAATQGITKSELLRRVEGKFGIVCISNNPVLDPEINAEVVEASGGTLKVVSLASVGRETVDVDSLKSRGIKIGYAGTKGTESTAEMAVALLLTVGRRINEFGGQTKRTPLSRLHYMSHSLENSTVGIIGCGRIGTSVAKKLNAFNISRLLYFARSEKPEVNVMGGELKSLQELIKESDFIVIALAMSKETAKIINRDLIASMKPTAIFVNVARGRLVDTEALTEALIQKRIAGAGLDVTDPEPLPEDHPLLKLNNVVITPHIAGETEQFIRGMNKLAAKNVIAAWEQKPLPLEL